MALSAASSLPTHEDIMTGKTWSGPFAATDYETALDLSMQFYYAQYSGDLPSGFPVTWRSDIFVNDGQYASGNVGRDLSGGWHDAGDLIKFGMPMAFSATTLAWGAIDYQQGYQQSGAYQDVVTHLEWVTDYLLRAYDNGGTPSDSSDDSLVIQVGDPGVWHYRWGTPNTTAQADGRDVLVADAQKPAQDIAGETAAAMASASIVMRADGQTALADQLLDKAQQLYKFAEDYSGLYRDPKLDGFYYGWASEDELAWGAAWIHKALAAKGIADQTYLGKAEQAANYLMYTWIDQSTGKYRTDKMFSYDAKDFGVAAILAEITGDQKYFDILQDHHQMLMEQERMQDTTSTNAGMSLITGFGSARGAAASALVELQYARLLAERGNPGDAALAEDLVDSSSDQIDYLLGDNQSGQSFQVGFGSNYPERPHHNLGSGLNGFGSNPGERDANVDNVHDVLGALVGGPAPDGPNWTYVDERYDYVRNEVGTEYNAAFSGALAALAQMAAGGAGATINGTSGNDTLNGTEAGETINGLGGNDTLNGNGGNDILNGGDGADTLNGGAGTDTLNGDGGIDTYITDGTDTINEAASAGTDTVQASVSYTLGANLENLTLTGSGAINGTGNALANTITGNSGSNVLNGGGGADTLVGGGGNDTYVTDGGDTITEGASAGTDTVQSSVTYTLGNNLENLTLTGTAAINGTGNALDNVLTGNSANNVLTGGAGNDTYIIQNTGDTVTEAASAGTDVVQSSVTYTLGANVENLTLTGTGAINGTGNTLNNVLTGNSANNVLAGGTGNDTYVIQNTGDTVTEAASAGTDLVQSSVTYTLGANVENLTLTGSAAINGTGNTLANVITGNSGNNVLNGGTGADTLSGGAGQDIFQFTTTLGASNIDTISGYSVADDTIQLDRAVMAAIGANGTLAAAAFRSNTTGAAQDADDRIIYNSSNGTVYYDSDGTGAAAAQAFVVLSTGLAVTNAEFVVIGAGGLNPVNGTSGDDYLTGTAGDDLITALGGNDIIVASGGNDQIDGGNGDDKLDYYGANSVRANFTFTQNGGGTVTVTSAFFGTDILTSIEGVWFEADGAWIPMEALVLTNTVTGTSGTDYLGGTAANDLINALDGNDIIIADEGNDRIDGGNGYDQLDCYGTESARANFTFVQNANGTITVTSAEFGTDILSSIDGVWFSADNAWASMSSLVLTNTVTGTSGADYLGGTAANDLINTLDGNDVIIAGQGNDRIDGGNGYDQYDCYGTESARANFTFVQNANGTVTVTSLAFGTDILSGVEGVWFSADNAWASMESLVLTNTVTGTSGADYLDGTAANDLIHALDGDDIIVGDEGNDRIDGGNGEDKLDFYGVNSVRTNFTFTQNANGTVTVTSADFGTDILSSIESVWFEEDAEWVPMEDLLAPAARSGADVLGAIA